MILAAFTVIRFIYENIQYLHSDSKEPAKQKVAF